jgi:hypothetical protein
MKILATAPTVMLWLPATAAAGKVPVRLWRAANDEVVARSRAMAP